MQRRAYLLPNLFQAAKAAGFNEQTVFGKIADARTKLAGAQKAEPKGSDGNKSPEQKQEIGHRPDHWCVELLQRRRHPGHPLRGLDGPAVTQCCLVVA